MYDSDGIVSNSLAFCLSAKLKVIFTEYKRHQISGNDLCVRLLKNGSDDKVNYTTNHWHRQLQGVIFAHIFFFSFLLLILFTRSSLKLTILADVLVCHNCISSVSSQWGCHQAKLWRTKCTYERCVGHTPITFGSHATDTSETKKSSEHINFMPNHSEWHRENGMVVLFW